jgi:elongation factor G
MKWHLDNIYRIPTNFNPPRIPYRETITKAAQLIQAQETVRRSRSVWEVHLIIEPYTEGAPELTMMKFGNKEIKLTIRGKDEIDLDWGGKLIYVNCIVGGSIDARFMPAILKGIMEKMEVGPLPVPMPGTSGYMYMTVRCILLIRTRSHSGWPEEMPSAWHLKMRA